jgi:hypothetical protein
MAAAWRKSEKRRNGVTAAAQRSGAGIISIGIINGGNEN